jgi:serine phosphatase RsbU (regulator of sigma subunit)
MSVFVESPEGTRNESAPVPPDSSVLIVDDEPFALEVLGDLLEGSGYHVYSAEGGEKAISLLKEFGGEIDCVVLDIRLGGPDAHPNGVDILKWVREEQPAARVIMMSAYATIDNAVDSLNLGADAYIRKPINSAELLATVAKSVERRQLTREKQRLEVMTQEQNLFLKDKNQELANRNKQLQAAYEVIRQDLILAEQLQRSMLPQEFPTIPGLHFAAQYVPSGTLAGDFYDVFRLDEQHLGFYVADAVGHGVRAALISALVKKSISFKEIGRRSYRLLGPGEVLANLNREILSDHLAEVPFVTAACFLLNTDTHVLRYATGGHPWPLLFRAGGEPQQLQTAGGIVGVFEQEFEEHTCTLATGDRLICYTDGIEHALGVAAPACIEGFQRMLSKHSSLQLDRMLEVVTQELLELAGGPGLDDDLALLGLDVREPS